MLYRFVNRVTLHAARGTALVVAAGLLALLLVGQAAFAAPVAVSVVPITGLAPPLRFHMIDASSGKLVTGRDFRGKVVLLYFGYTNCADVCPDTLYKIHQIFLRLQKTDPSVARRAVLLFVTVDPHRDTITVLHHYLGLFDPHFIGLRGGANALYRITRRYRVVASVHPSANPADYQVVHSALVYVFGPHGNARFVLSGMGRAPKPDYRTLAKRVQALATAPPQDGVLTGLARFN